MEEVLLLDLERRGADTKIIRKARRNLKPENATLIESETVRLDVVCEVGGSTPDLSYGDLGIFPGGGGRT